MPYEIVKRTKDGKEQFCVVKKDDPQGESFGCHPTEKEAQDQMAAMMANSDEGKHTHAFRFIKAEMDMAMMDEMMADMPADMRKKMKECVRGKMDEGMGQKEAMTTCKTELMPDAEKNVKGYRKAITDAPNLRGTEEHRCACCKFYKMMTSADGSLTGVCEKFEFESHDDWLCDAWQMKEPEQMNPMPVVVVDENEMAMDEKSLIAFGDSVKALGNGKVGGYLVRFTKRGDYDLEGDRFDAQTDFGAHVKSPIFYDHGLDIKLGQRALGEGTLKKEDEVGIWIEAQLNLRDEYEQAIYDLVKSNKLSWSSGTASHLVERVTEGKGNYIKRWLLGLDASLTTTPAEHRNQAIQLKTFKSMTRSQEAKPEAVGTLTAAEATVMASTTSNSKTVTATVTTGGNTHGEKFKMDELKTLVGSVDALTKNVDTLAQTVTKLADEQATIKKALEQEKPPALGIQVNPDQKYPYKNFVMHGREIKDATGYGEFLQDVAFVALNPGRAPSTRLTAVHEMAAKAIKASGANVAIPSQGGFFVQTDHNAELVRMMFQSGDILSRVRKIPLGPDADSVTLNGVDETSRASTLWGGIQAYWLAEAGSITSSQPKWRQIRLETKGLAALYYATDKLLKVASALGSLVAEGFREAMTFKVEDAIVNGNGSGKPYGIVSAAATVSISKETGQAAATLTTTNLSKMWARLHTQSKKNAVWLINTDCNPQLDELSLTAGVSALEPRFVRYNDEGMLTIKGRQVVETEHCQTLGTVGDIVLWDPSSYLFADLGEVAEASSIHVNFTTAEQAFRYLYYCDGQPMLASAITPAHGNNSLTTQLTLATRS